MEKLQIASKILLSLALIYFSTAMIMFVIEVGKTRVVIPEILDAVSRLKVDAGIPKILTQLSEITEEISLVRKEIPAILLQVEKTREAIPSILEQVKQVNSHIPEILRQVEETRKTIPPILEELAAVREALPESLAKAQKIVDDANEISVVGGVAKGVVSAPFKLFKKDGEESIPEEEGK